MPLLQYDINSSKNDGLPMSPSELESTYFFGIPLVDPNGNRMSESDLTFAIKSAMEEMEGTLNIKMTKQVIQETQSYHINDYRSWGFIPTSYPVKCAGKLSGFMGKQEQVIYPPEWLMAKKTNDGIGYHRSMYLIPTTGTPTNGSNSVVYSGVAPHFGHWGASNIPHYWNVTYITSFDRMPEDILNAMGKLAAINVFHQLGDIILQPGIASQSIGIDGLSTSISTTSSATNAGFGARVTGYIADLKRTIPLLKSKYGGIIFTAC
jgi:hypothetical protein